MKYNKISIFFLLTPVSFSYIWTQAIDVIYRMLYRIIYHTERVFSTVILYGVCVQQIVAPIET